MKLFQAQLGFEKQLLGVGLAGLVALGGCGSASPGGAEGFNPSASSDTAASASSSTNPALQQVSAKEGGASTTTTTTATAQLIQKASAVPRKIIYNATVDLIADNFSSAQGNLLALIKTHGGYLSETNIGGTPGTPRQGTWKIRIPETRFSAFMNAVVKLGELQTTHTDSQDVTAEFYDLQARISNKQVEEKRLIVHLQRSTAKLSEILQVERELSRVRGEIEQMQGRLRLLANMTSLTTITVTLREVKGYVAPKPTTFTSEISRTFAASFGGLRDFGKNIVLMIVGILPWLPLMALIGFPVWRMTRRQNRKPSPLD